MDAWKWLADNAPDWVQGELAQEKEQLKTELERWRNWKPDDARELIKTEEG